MPLSQLLVKAGNLWYFLVCRSIIPASASVFTWHSLCVSVSKFPSPYEDTSHIGLRPTNDLTKIAKTLFPNKVTFTGFGG